MAENYCWSCGHFCPLDPYSDMCKSCHDSYMEQRASHPDLAEWPEAWAEADADKYNERG
jgi:hypothetical protein